MWLAVNVWTICARKRRMKERQNDTDAVVLKFSASHPNKWPVVGLFWIPNMDILRLWLTQIQREKGVLFLSWVDIQSTRTKSEQWIRTSSHKFFSSALLHIPCKWQAPRHLTRSEIIGAQDMLPVKYSYFRSIPSKEKRCFLRGQIALCRRWTSHGTDKSSCGYFCFITFIKTSSEEWCRSSLQAHRNFLSNLEIAVIWDNRPLPCCEWDSTQHFWWDDSFVNKHDPSLLCMVQQQRNIRKKYIFCLQFWFSYCLVSACPLLCVSHKNDTS